MCELCQEVNGTSDRIIYKDDVWALVPTVGCFIPGYCILVPRDHSRSFATLGTELPAAEELASQVRSTIAKIMGRPVIIAEHGPGNRCNGAACCDHAHLHFIPTKDPQEILKQYTMVGGTGKTLKRMSELQPYAGFDYVYLSTTTEHHQIWPAAGFEKQFVRRVCAAAVGLPDFWDWRRFPFRETMALTKSLLEGPFNSIHSKALVDETVVGTLS